MSRIHDALRKAEEEQLQAFGSMPDLEAQESETADQSGIALEIVGNNDALASAMADSDSNTKAPIADDSILQNCNKAVWSPTNDALFLTSQDNHALGLEEFRTLRSKLFQIRAKRPLKTLLVSSALPGEGKSFVSANLAQVFARQRGGRTLLIDADLRKPHMHELLGAPAGPGLFEYLSGRAGDFEIIQRSMHDDLFFIPGGHINSKAAELIGNGRINTLIERLAPLFNWIVIDSSPVIPVSDPVRLAALTDGVLLVVQACSTPHLLAERAKREFHDSPILGVVFNRVPKKGNPYYNYSYGKYRK